MDFKTHLIFLVWASFVIGALAQHQGESNSSSANYYQLTSGQLPQFCPGSYSDQGTAVMQTCLRIQIVQSRITFFRGKYTQAHYCGSWEDTVKLNIASCGRNISDSSVPSCKAPCQNFEHALLYIYHKLRFFALILEDVILDQFMGPFFQCGNSEESFKEDFDKIKVDLEGILCGLAQYLRSTDYDEEPQELHREWQNVYESNSKPECRGFNFLYDFGVSISALLDSLNCT
ncbi:uncharacterized protein LOC143041711 [Oratosquilla oratoria]|uniref:uncharacterized protein LOC143041711 n=1 Tax=Oratosquilla oratoria TaxID=337810 RepID=UPI003F774280